MKKNKIIKGFSLLELLISIFIFSVVILSISFIFSKTIINYRYSKDIQENLESAQFILNSMAKIIREREIEEPSAPVVTNVEELVVKTDGDCYRYFYDPVAKTVNIQKGVDCANLGLASVAIRNVELLNFRVSPTINTGSPKQVGLVTIRVRLCAESTCTHSDKINLQTSVSLRNF
jgi:prepilin-type N-terminal cleavage/methylation domain-containing protein